MDCHSVRRRSRVKLALRCQGCLHMEAEGPFRRDIHEVQDLIQQSYARS
jgi:hypothetical protein